MGLVASGARRSHALAAALTRIGMALGGKAGARLAGHLGMQTSDDALLRLVRASPLPMAAPPAILGVDDWAWKRGRRYGTILCDLEQHRAVDLLPERSADSVAAWLSAFPGVTAIARDRSDLYADGANRGAPRARQIADRFHLMMNLGESLDHFLQHKRAAIKQALAPAVPSITVPAEPGQPWQERQEADSLRRPAAVRARYERVVALHAKGAEIANIARAVGISRDRDDDNTGCSTRTSHISCAAGTNAATPPPGSGARFGGWATVPRTRTSCASSPRCGYRPASDRASIASAARATRHRRHDR